MSAATSNETNTSLRDETVLEVERVPSVWKGPKFPGTKLKRFLCSEVSRCLWKRSGAPLPSSSTSSSSQQ